LGIFSGILDLLFPPRCVFCRRFLKKGETEICGHCKDSLPYCEGDAVRQTGEFYARCISPLYYKAHVRASILRFKFQEATAYVGCYGKILAHCIEEQYGHRYDLITWAPVSARRKKKRGYDQAMLLAYATALELEDVAVETLVKTRDIPAQSTLAGGDARRANVSGVYMASDPELIDGKRILLIDDIITTGSTLSECARTLLMAGAEEVMCAVIARAE